MVKAFMKCEMLGVGSLTHLCSRVDAIVRRCFESCRTSLGCSTSLSCISKGFGGFYSRLWRLRTGKLSSALRLHGFTHMFGHPSGDILDAHRAQRLGHEVLGEFTAHARNQQD